MPYPGRWLLISSGVHGIIDTRIPLTDPIIDCTIIFLDDVRCPICWPFINDEMFNVFVGLTNNALYGLFNVPGTVIYSGYDANKKLRSRALFLKTSQFGTVFLFSVYVRSNYIVIQFNLFFFFAFQPLPDSAAIGLEIRCEQKGHAPSCRHC
jgi:hypothetical protein